MSPKAARGGGSGNGNGPRYPGPPASSSGSGDDGSSEGAALREMPSDELEELLRACPSLLDDLELQRERKREGRRRRAQTKADAKEALRLHAMERLAGGSGGGAYGASDSTIGISRGVARPGFSYASAAGAAVLPPMPPPPDEPEEDEDEEERDDDQRQQWAPPPSAPPAPATDSYNDNPFPALPRPAAPGRVLAPPSRPWTTVAPPKRGGRSAVAANAVAATAHPAPRVLNRSCAVRTATQRQTAATGIDLAWDLEMSGLRPLADPLPSGRRLSHEVGEEEAADLRARAAAAAAGDGSDDDGGSGGGDGGVGARSPGTLREMMARTARAGRGGGGGGDGDGGEGSKGQGVEGGAPSSVFGGFGGGGSAAYGRSWRQLERTMRERGWREQGAATGGGGGHRKFRRTLPLSGVVQTIVTPSTPGDAIRGVRNVAAQLYKLDREAEQLEEEGAAAAEGGAGWAAGR